MQCACAADSKTLLCKFQIVISYSHCSKRKCCKCNRVDVIVVWIVLALILALASESVINDLVNIKISSRSAVLSYQPGLVRWNKRNDCWDPVHWPVWTPTSRCQTIRNLGIVAICTTQTASARSNTPRHTRETDQHHHMSVQEFSMQSDSRRWVNRAIRSEKWHTAVMHAWEGFWIYTDQTE